MLYTTLPLKPADCAGVLLVMILFVVYKLKTTYVAI